MEKLPVTTEIMELFEKIESIRNDYADAGQRAKEEATHLKEGIEKLQSEAHEAYKSYVLDIVTLEQYEKAKRKLDDKEAMLSIAEGKANSINQLMNEEIHKVYKEIEALQPAFNKENRTNKEEQQKAIFTAKKEYLKAITDAGRNTKKSDTFHYKIDKLKVDLGLKNDYEYDFDNINVQAILSNPYTGKAGAEVGRQAIEKSFDTK